MRQASCDGQNPEGRVNSLLLLYCCNLQHHLVRPDFGTDPLICLLLLPYYTRGIANHGMRVAADETKLHRP